MADSKTIMIVAGGPWQVPLIRRAKDLGHRVINTNLYEDSPGFAFADIGLVADVLDREANLAIAQRHRPDAIVTDQSDIAVPTVAYLCDELGLPGIGPACAHRFTDKTAMRRSCREFSMPHPSFQPCESLGELSDFYRRTGGRLVVKPCDSQGGRGVVRVDGTEGLAGAFQLSRSFSRDGRVLAEEYIDGLEITVEGIQLPDGHLTLAMSTKRPLAHNPMVAEHIYYASTHAEFDHETLRLQHDRFIDAMGLPFGITHTEYKVREGVFYLIETAARGGGNTISSLIAPLMSGVDSNAMLIRMALGQDPGPVQMADTPRHTMLQFLQFEPGVVAALVGLDEARAQEGVLSVDPTFKPGDTLALPRNDPERHMQAILTADSHAELDVRIARLLKTIEVRYA